MVDLVALEPPPAPRPLWLCSRVIRDQGRDTPGVRSPRCPKRGVRDLADLASLPVLCTEVFPFSYVEIPLSMARPFCGSGEDETEPIDMIMMRVEEVYDMIGCMYPLV